MFQVDFLSEGQLGRVRVIEGVPDLLASKASESSGSSNEAVRLLKQKLGNPQLGNPQQDRQARMDLVMIPILFEDVLADAIQ